MQLRSSQDIYARQVASTRGYPLWGPEPSCQFYSYHPQGLRIGDVGFVARHGNFEVLFNICLPEDEQFNKGAGLPDGFNPIQLSEADIKTVLNAESAGQVVMSPSVAQMDNNGPIAGDVLPKIDPSRTACHRFNLSKTEGGFLILPEGADCHDIRDPRPFFDLASRQAASWYEFAEDKLGRIISHDAIYVITGFHKARSWVTAAYESEDGTDSEAQFIVHPREKGESVRSTFGWQSMQNVDWRFSPQDGSEISNQSVIIRGFKIALRSNRQGVPQKWVSFQRPSSSESWLSSAWRGISRTIGMSSDDAGYEARGEVRVEISQVPPVLPMFHPSDVINRYILQKEPSAKVAITHDSDWGTLLAKNILKPEELIQDALLIEAISKSYNTVVREGVAYLQTTSGLESFIDAAMGECEIVQPGQPESLSVVSESSYRCVRDASLGTESRPTGLQSITSKIGSASSVDTAASPGSLRPVKIIVMSDYLCVFCYICDKAIRDAIEACRDLPIRFDVEFRPFTLVNVSALPQDQIAWRNPYLVKKYGKEKAELLLKAASELSQKAGLKIADDSIVTATIQAHRLSIKAYKDGGSDMQDKINMFIFDACLAKKMNIGDEAVLVDVAVSAGLMNKEEATAFLRSTEYQECVEKMIEAAKAQGINGVPFVIIDGKWAVNGLQPVECFTQIFRKLAQSPTPVAVKTNTDEV